MPSAAEIRDDGRFVGLFVGESGHGKTAAALSFPHPIRVFDMDGRIRGGLTDWIERKGIDYDYYPPLVEKSSVFQKLNSDLEVLLIQARNLQCPYKTVVFDSITKAAVSFLLDAIPLTHSGGKGKSLGVVKMGGPEDYGYQSTAVSSILAFFKSLMIPNIILTAHIVPRYGKNPGDENKFAESVIIGEKLALTDKLAATVPGDFDHIFKFEKRDTGSKVIFNFNAQGDLARTPYKIPYGDIDITGKSFYNELQKYVRKDEPTQV